MNETTEMTPCQETEDKQEVKEDQHKTEQDGQIEKISDQEKVEDKTLSQPAVFIPVDRLPEIQVCVKATGAPFTQVSFL